MSRIVLSKLDEKLVAEAKKTHAIKNIAVAVDATVENQMLATKLGLDYDACIGADKAPAPAPAKKVEKPKKVEAKKDVKPKSE